MTTRTILTLLGVFTALGAFYSGTLSLMAYIQHISFFPWLVGLTVLFVLSTVLLVSRLRRLD